MGKLADIRVLGGGTAKSRIGVGRSPPPRQARGRVGLPAGSAVRLVAGPPYAYRPGRPAMCSSTPCGPPNARQKKSVLSSTSLRQLESLGRTRILFSKSCCQLPTVNFQLFFSVPPQPKFLSRKSTYLGATHEGVCPRIAGAIRDVLFYQGGAGSRGPGGHFPHQYPISFFNNLISHPAHDNLFHEWYN